MRLPEAELLRAELIRLATEGELDELARHRLPRAADLALRHVVQAQGEIKQLETIIRRRRESLAIAMDGLLASLQDLPSGAAHGIEAA